jgi:nickel/cobalt exporter
MTSLTQVFDASAGNAYLFIPSAILLGALHGLEPGHSKTMMAAFIVAIRGTVAQAIMLGLAATLSHTAIVWIVALGGVYLGGQWSTERTEPYLQIASGVLILSVAAWMMWRTWSERRAALGGKSHDHGHRHPHPHPHPHHHHGHGHAHDHAHHDEAHTHRHDDHDHAEDEDHGHPHPPEPQGHHHRNFGHARHEHPHPRPNAAKEAVFKHDLLLVDPSVFTDAHEREHALDINRRFANRQATTGQIILFGLTGGLIPCPASITVLLLCLQVGKIALGAALVLCFSIGLAITMVAVGVAAALSLRHVSGRWKGFEAFAARAPYISGALVALVGVYTLWLGVSGLA